MSVESIILAAEEPVLQSPPLDEVLNLRKEVEKLKAENSCLQEEMFGQSSISHRAEFRYEELCEQHRILQRQFKKYEKKTEENTHYINKLTLELEEKTLHL